MGRSQAKAIRTVPLLAVVLGMVLALTVHWPSEPLVRVQAAVLTQSGGKTIAQKPAPDFPLQAHPLPPTLAQWHDPKEGDYFDQIKTVPVGYLIWSTFPITIHLQPPTATELANPFTAQRSQVWLAAAGQAVKAWQPYLPLKLVSQAEGANIVMLRTPPPLQLEVDEAQTTADENNPPSQRVQAPHPTLRLGRARSAVTSYKIYAEGVVNDRIVSKPVLAHRFTIQLRPDQAPQYLQAAALHELGHALGIWGHSLSQTDVMYFSQVRQPPPISSRDLNTLKRIYEQPTRLGWALTE